MYQSYYNLVEKPFKINTDPRFIWFGEQHQEAMANLRYGLQDRNGFIVLTGDAGTGKTTLVNALLETLDEKVRVVKINHPSLEVNEFLSLFAKTLDANVAISDKSDLIIFLNDYLQKAHADGEVVILIVDEAHRLTNALLEEIRLLSNIEKAGEKLLSFVLVGQDEIKPMLMDPQCRSLRQRITSIYDIQPLTELETWEYIEYRLKVSGTTKPLFTTAAITEVYAISGGNPRVINTLCDRALLTGFVRETVSIDADIISECGGELNLDRQIKSAKHSGRITNRIPLRRPLLLGLKPWIGSMNETLAAIFESVKRHWNHGVVTMQHACRVSQQWLYDFMGKAIRYFSQKFQRKSISAIMAMGVALSFVLMTIGMYSGATVQEDTSGAAIDQSETDPVATRTDWPEAQTAHISWELTPIELAALAMEEDNNLRVVEVPASHQIEQTENRAEIAEMNANLLVSQSKEIMDVSPAEAEALLLKAVDVDPGQVDAYFMLAKKYTKDQDYPRAIEAYQHLVQIDPRASDAIFNLGFLYATTGEFEAAEKAFERVVQLRPSYEDKTLFNLAVVQENLGKRSASIANLEKVVRMAPENEKALAYLNTIKAASAAEDIEFKR